MIRLLYLAPVIGVIGAIIIIYMFFIRPVFKNDKGQNVSASSAINGINADLIKMKKLQAYINSTIEAKKNEYILEGDNMTRIYQMAIKKQLKNIQIANLGVTMDAMHKEALELAGSEQAIQQFDDQLRNGLASLDRDMKGVHVQDFFKPKQDVAARINLLRNKLDSLHELENSIVVKAEEYTAKTKISIRNIKSVVKENTELMSKDFQQDIRRQNLEQSLTAKEITQQRIERMRENMATIREKIEANKEKIRDSQDRMKDAQQRANDARIHAHDVQEMVNDRFKK